MTLYEMNTLNPMWIFVTLFLHKSFQVWFFIYFVYYLNILWRFNESFVFVGQEKLTILILWRTK